MLLPLPSISLVMKILFSSDDDDDSLLSELCKNPNAMIKELMK
jgi:hypothetical protein